MIIEGMDYWEGVLRNKRSEKHGVQKGWQGVFNILLAAVHEKQLSMRRLRCRVHVAAELR